MIDDFVSLHTHCEYSFLDGFGHPKQFVARAKELGQTAIAITDHGNVSAHKKWHDECKKADVKPILGLEAYVTDDATAKNDRRMWHITLLAKNATGYRNLLKLVTASWEDGFYYKPRTDWEMLRQYSEGIVATSGCPSGRIGRGISKDAWTSKEVVSELKRQAGIFKDYYVELSPWKYQEGIGIAQQIYKAAKTEGLPIILTMDAHYPCAKDAHIQDVMLCIQNNVKFSDPNRMRFSQDDFCLHSGADMEMKWRAIHGNRLPFLDEMITNTKKIADSVNLVFPSAVPLSFPLEGDKNKFFRDLCEKGLKAKKLHDRPAYRERMEYEFELILSKNFVDYFLVVSDMIVWAKENGIVVGAARGSSCGSLICFILRITEIDPLLHGLMFERFIDVSRKDLPDIDIDFESERRDEVKGYLATKYGNDRIANLATFGTFKGKLCLQDIGRVFSDKIPWEAVEETKRLVIQRSSADSRYGATIEDTFTNFEQAAEHLKKYPELGLAKELEGQIRQLGIHAAGVVISNEPIGNFAAIYVTSKKDRVISMDYADASSVGLLKIDILGLTVLTALKRTIELINKRHGKKIEITELPLDDAAVYENFCKQKLHGIFQFEGESTRQVCRQIQPRNFEALVAINALSRPGPLHSGGTTSFIERRFGREKVKPLHPSLEEITHATYGITVYQEQVMQVVRVMGKFDWSGIATVRKMMSKKYGDEAFGAMQAKFVDGAKSQGVTEADAVAVWKNICTFGAWAFNKSHSVAYSTIAYHLMWLKTHYPLEFYASVISCEPDDEKRRRMLKEYTNGGGKLLPVDVNESERQLACNGIGLRLGYDSVIGFREDWVDQVIQRKPFNSFIDFSSRCQVPDKQSEKLLKIGAFRNLTFTAVKKQRDLFGDDEAVRDDFDYRFPSQADVLEHCPLAAENKEQRQFQDWLKTKVKERVWTLQDLDGIDKRTDVLIIGRTNPSTSFDTKNKMEEAMSRGNEWESKSGEEALTKEQYNFLNFNLEDETDLIIVRVSYKLYPKFKDMLWAIKPSDVVAVRGMCNGTMRMAFAYSIVNLTNLKAKIEAGEPLTGVEQDFLSGKKEKRSYGHARPQKTPIEEGCGF